MLSPALAMLARRHGAFLVVLAALAAGYLWLNWYDGLGSLMGDGIIYISTARYYAPYWPTHPIDEIWATFTQFPPVYPAVLAATGGAADLRLAHAVTALCYVASFAAFYAWLVAVLGVSRLRAAATAALLGLAPGTFLQSFHLYPEGLYVTLAFLVLVALARGEDTARASWFWAASAAVGIAIVTRTVGVTLLPALLVVLVRSRPAYWPGMVALAVAPAVGWSLVHHPPFSYTDALRDQYAGATVEAIAQSLWNSTESAALGLVHNVCQNPDLKWVAVPLGAIAGVVTLLRGSRWRPDAWYLLAYLATLAIWPYPVEGPRLTWVVLPIVLGYLVRTGEQLAARIPPRLRRPGPAVSWAFVAVIALMVLPEFALLATRAVHPLARAHPAYRHLPQWYTPALENARAMTEMHIGVARAFHRFAPQIPPDQCFFSTLQDLGSFYTRREAHTPLPSTADDREFDEDLRQAGCRYFVFTIASARNDDPILYPIHRLRDRVRILDVERMDVAGEPTVAVLGVLRQP